MTPKVLDVRKESIEPGDYFVKAQRQSSSVWLNLYKATEIVEGRDAWSEPTWKIRGEIISTTGYSQDIGRTTTVEAKNVIRVELP